MGAPKALAGGHLQKTVFVPASTKGTNKVKVILPVENPQSKD